jgi:hypothetical protein
MAGITATPEWIAAAVSKAANGSKLSSSYSANAINKYLSTGSTAGLSKTQAAQVQKAIKAVGAPTAATPTDTSGNSGGGFVDPMASINASIDSAYSPVMDFLKSQATAAQDRFGQNKADITNLFGTLSTVRAADIPKIQQQYATSIQQQQDAVAQRMALQNVQTQQGAQGAATAGAELGGADMPAPTNSLSAQAGTAANTDANAYQTTWNALQQVMSAQDQQNVRNAQYGYDAQQSSALLQMQRSLEDRLAQINGDIAGTQSQIAQSKMGAASSAAEMAQESANLVAKNQTATDVANIGANARMTAAQIAANARTSAAKSKGAPKTPAPKPKTYASNVSGWTQKIIDSGGTQSNITSIRNQVQKAYDAAKAVLVKAGTTGAPTKTQIINQWNRIYGNKTWSGPVSDYISSGYYK